MKQMVLILFLLIPIYGYSQVRVAFLEMINPNGSVAKLEPGGRYFHLALQIDSGLWFHAHPLHGTILTKSLDPKLGVVTQVLENYEMPLITYEDVKPYLGRSFDKTYSFKSQTMGYCSKEPAIILRIPPKPKMKFKGKAWEKAVGLKKNQPGWSPDYNFNYLLNNMGFTPLVPFIVRQRVNVLKLSLPIAQNIKTNLLCLDVLR